MKLFTVNLVTGAQVSILAPFTGNIVAAFTRSSRGVISTDINTTLAATEAAVDGAVYTNLIAYCLSTLMSDGISFPVVANVTRLYFTAAAGTTFVVFLK